MCVCLRCGNTVLFLPLWIHCKSRRLRCTVCCCFPWPRVSPCSEKRCLPPKMALIQIKLNEVRAANPCVFQLLTHPPPHHPHKWVGQAHCIWPPLHWPCSQAARLPVPRRRQQQAPLWLSAPLRLHVCVSVWRRVSVFHCKFVIVLFLFSLIQCWFPFACFAFATACLHVCLSSRKIYFCLQLAYTFHTFLGLVFFFLVN